jgi:hypothetical protein
MTGFPTPAYVPPSAFLTLSTVFSFACLAGLFHPTTTSEICSSGFSPNNQPSWLSPARALLPLVAVFPATCALERAGAPDHDTSASGLWIRLLVRGNRQVF